ncbi:MAG: acyl-CoA thioesterase [Opitutaceae bacterium]|nr:acyl-CoA thioesterase [Opitutaceae bacterium]
MNAETPQGAAGSQGRLVIRTIAMPCDTNARGDIFGGWLMSQLDLGGAVLAQQLANGRVTTVAVEKLDFIAPVKVGDTVTCFARLLSRGRTSMRLGLEAWATRHGEITTKQVARGIYIYVAIDAEGRPAPVPESARAEEI